MNSIQKANAAFNKEANKQFKLLFPIFVIVLSDRGMKELAIKRRLVEVQELWNECSTAGASKSMLQMLEEETGIEMTLDGVDSYHNYYYLDGSLEQPATLSAAQWIYMRKRQQKWIPAQLEACFALAMHRYDNFGYERIRKLISDIDAYRKDIGDDTERTRKLMEIETGFKAEEVLPH